MSQILDYVSGEPGVGKTNWILKRLKKNIEERTSIAFYVAPTKMLLTQVMNELVEQVGYKKATKFISTVWTNSSSDTVDDLFSSALSGKPVRGGFHVTPIRKGSVVFLTHEGFLRLSPNLLSDKLKRRTYIYFDEARKIVFPLIRFPRMKKQIRDIFRVVFKAKTYRESKYARLTVRKMFMTHDPDVVHPALEQMLNSLPRGVPLHQAEFLRKLYLSANNSRLELYATLGSRGDGSESYGVVLPSKVFEGFKHTVLLSAHFENSQMYFMLKNTDGISLRNVTHKIKSIEKRQAQVLERYKSVTIVPLTLGTDLISKYKYINTFMVPDTDVPILGRKFNELGLVSKDVRAVSSMLRRSEIGIALTKAQRKALKFLKKRDIHTDVMDWHIESALKVVKRWRKKTGAAKERPLIFTNTFHEPKVAEYVGKLTRVSTYAYGMNTYQNANVVIFLAAINPTPGLKAFLEVRLKGYNPTKDFVVDSCAQCVARSSLRDVNSTSPVLIVVPDETLATHLLERFSSARIHRSYAKRLGNYVYYNLEQFILGKKMAADELLKKDQMFKDAVKDLQDADAALVKVKRKKEELNYLAHPLNKQRRRLDNKRAYRKRNLEKAKLDGDEFLIEKHKNAIKVLEKAIIALDMERMAAGLIHRIIVPK